VAYAAAKACDRRSVFTHQVAALICVKWRHSCHLEIMMSNQKSDWRVFMWRTFLPNFTLIQFEMTEPQPCFEEISPRRRKRRRRRTR